MVSSSAGAKRADVRVPLLGDGLEGVEAGESAREDRVRLFGVELGVTSDGRPRLLPDDFEAGDDFAAVDVDAARLAAAASIRARFVPFFAGALVFAGAFGNGCGR